MEARTALICPIDLIYIYIYVPERFVDNAINYNQKESSWRQAILLLVHLS